MTTTEGNDMPSTPIDTAELETRVKDMYRDVAENPRGEYHFEMGRGLAERLGYPPDVLDRIPAEAIESFAGVGHHLGLAALAEGESVLDLGSGSGMDVFFAAVRVGESGRVVGLDMTEAQLRKAEALRDRDGFGQVEFVQGRIEEIPLPDASFDCVISNGVINLSPEKGAVFAEIARVLRPGGRLAVSDIVTERPLAESIVCNVSLWASCIGGAITQDDYGAAIREAGLEPAGLHDVPEYEFISESARNASAKYGVKSVCVLARRP